MSEASYEEYNTEESNGEQEQKKKQQQQQPLVIPVDKGLENYRAYRVYKNYSCYLQRVDDQKNFNKFYLMQLLEHFDERSTYCIFSRWGKQGSLGYRRMSKTFSNIQEARDLFEKRFLEKCGLEWHQRDKLDEYTGRYKIVKDDMSLKLKGKQMESPKKEPQEQPQSQQSQKSQQQEKRSRPKGGKSKEEIMKCFDILKDICYELNVLNDEEDAAEKIEQMSDQLLGLIPQNLKKKHGPIKDNETIKEYFVMLSEFQEKQRGEE